MYQVAFIVVFSVLTIARVYYRVTSGAIHDRVVNRREGVFLVVWRWVAGIPLFLATGLFLIGYEQAEWMYLTLPTALRIGGFVLGCLAVSLIVWVHRELGSCFSSSLVIRPDHHLVRSGPYRYVRHPMYAAYLLLFIGAFGISANWVIGSSGTAIILSLMTVRLPREERMLIDRFGEEYEEYRRTTGMFLPLTHRLPGRAPL